MRSLGSTLEGEGKWAEAESAHREALVVWRKRAGNEDQQTLHTLHRLGLTLENEGKWAEAESVHRERLAVWRKRGENESPQALTELQSLTRDLMAQTKFGDAEQLLDEALTAAFVRQPSSANLLDIRIDLKARRGL